MIPFTNEILRALKAVKGLGTFQNLIIFPNGTWTAVYQMGVVTFTETHGLVKERKDEKS